MVTGTEVTAAGIAVLIGKEIFSTVRAYFGSKNGNGNGNGKSSPVQVNVTDKHDNNGKRICDFCVPLHTDTAGMKRDIKDLNGKCDKMDQDIGSIRDSQLNTHRKLDVMLGHYGLSEWGAKNK